MIKKLRETSCWLISPDYGLAELVGRREPIKRFANITDTEFSFLLVLLEQAVHTVEHHRYRGDLNKAKMLAPHEKDTPYFALAIHANAPIWSDESAFRDQTPNSIYTTNQLRSYGLPTLPAG